jgi:AcrR family transcriptional regulator
LLEAALPLFSERGFDGVSTEDLARRAGVNKALISYHFGGKRGLYREVLATAFGSIAERLHALESEKLPARESLRRLLRAIEAWHRERPAFPVLFVREVLASGIDPVVAPRLLEVLGFMRRLGERGAREGIFRRVEPLLFHFGLVGAIVFFMATEPARRRAVAERRVPFKAPELPSFLRHMEELTLRGLAPDNPARRRKGARA